MRYPTEVWLFQYRESCRRKRLCILIESRQVCRFGIFASPVTQTASKSGKLRIHVNNDTSPAGPQEATDILHTPVDVPQPVTITYRINSEYQVERTD